MNDCIFCKIIKGDIPTEKILDNDHVVAFRDAYPQAPVHLLVVSKKHISTLNDITKEDGPILSSMLLAAHDLAAKMGIAKEGFRTIVNCNKAAGQVVFHLHMHVMGGRKLGSIG